MQVSYEVVKGLIDSINTTRGQDSLIFLTTRKVYHMVRKIHLRHEKRARRFPCLYKQFHPHRRTRVAGK